MKKDGRNDFIQYTTLLHAKNNAAVSGDAFSIVLTDDSFVAVLVDGLGSGIEANVSAKIVTEELERDPTCGLDDILQRSNARMLGKRGAVAAVIRIRFQQQIIEFSSIGNITCKIFRQLPKKIIYPRRTVGYLSGVEQGFFIQAVEYYSGDSFILHTDGIEIIEAGTLFSEEEFIKFQYGQSTNLKLQNDDASFIAGRLF
ncbi:SpoIIE family protein phosphatase [Kurthia sibirica]|uniref:PPM-type phosphatase domain-containing protein n=1 Tax=Kurthia sibirica TaxID=202750 RepID=A0A2U3AK43_9BACL|nr:SpoIIE family protein phosphatase [Kurthia sibirica]PWI24885.1 hypothetical protein DEX24_10730 [Kurthia sibirica]GEK33212.1 phosphoserine phosphatase RsbX [Kurthia sibirica]